MWVLTPDHDASRLTIRLRPNTMKTIGRAVRADFVVDAALVSRAHCRLTATSHGSLEVLDLDSTNGTFVNERRVSRAVLVSGDRLRLGRLELVVSRARAVSRARTSRRAGSVAAES